MNRILIASAALLGLAGVAAAQEAPALYGSNYSPAVRQSQSADQLQDATRSAASALDTRATSSIRPDNGGSYDGTVTVEDVRSGR